VVAIEHGCTTSSHLDPPGYAPSSDPLSPSSPPVETGRREDSQKGNSYTLKIKTGLPFYESASSIYEQIFSLHEMLTKISEIFLLATGAVWVAVASNELSLPLWMRVALCVLIAVAGVQMSIVNYGALRSIRARFEMVDKIGEVSFPTILALGRGSFSDGAPEWATWGKNRKDFFWYLVPIAGVVGSIVLAVKLLVDA
jgi:hypothetical protein